MRSVTTDKMGLFTGMLFPPELGIEPNKDYIVHKDVSGNITLMPRKDCTIKSEATSGNFWQRLAKKGL